MVFSEECGRPEAGGYSPRGAAKTAGDLPYDCKKVPVAAADIL